MKAELTLFIGTFTTLLAISNPLECLPIFLKLLDGKDTQAQEDVARRACIYGGGLLLFFLLFGNLMLRLFDVPLSMVRSGRASPHPHRIQPVHALSGK